MAALSFLTLLSPVIAPILIILFYLMDLYWAILRKFFLHLICLT